MLSLSWDQITMWRLARHHLRPRAAPTAAHEVIRAICGLHAQLLSAAELALWARTTHLAAGWLEAALWGERTLAKSWLMRGTLHVLAADDLPLYVAARQTVAPRRPPSYFTYHGVTPEELEAIGAGVRAALGATPMTREELAGAVAAHAGAAHLAEVLRSGWGALLKPSAAQGDLCFGPDRGRNVTFVRPDVWLHRWERPDPQQALHEVARRYLAAYGPATPDMFARWWGVEPAAAKRLFRTLGDELASVDVDGWRGWALATSLPQLEQASSEPSVALLPGFDPYTVALCRHPAVLPERYIARVSRPQGWISPVVLVNGRIVGTWEHERQRGATELRVALFDELSGEARELLATEAERLGIFLGTPVALLGV